MQYTPALCDVIAFVVLCHPCYKHSLPVDRKRNQYHVVVTQSSPGQLSGMGKRTMRHIAAGSLAIAMLTSGVAIAQQPIFYPAQGQSPEKQGQDQAACQSWATQQTGATP